MGSHRENQFYLMGQQGYLWDGDRAGRCSDVLESPKAVFIPLLPKKKSSIPGVMVNAYSSSVQKAEVGGSL